MQQAVLSVFVQQGHADIKRYNNWWRGCFTAARWVRVEDGFAALAPCRGRSEVEEEGPGCFCRDALCFCRRVKFDVVTVVNWVCQ